MPKEIMALLVTMLIVMNCTRTFYAEGRPDENSGFRSFTGCMLTNDRDLEQFMDTVFKKKMGENHIPGAVIIVVKDGKPFFSKGYGYADLENKIPVSPSETLMPICSVTKLFTADAIMQLNERGQINLEEDVNNYLTSFTLKNSFAKPVTVKQLLTHTSGIDDQRIGDLSDRKTALPHVTPFLKEHMMPVVREPGSIIQYGSYEIALAGCLVEEITGVPYEEYIINNICKPLGMHKSVFLAPDIVGLGKSYKYEDEKYSAIDNPGYMNISPAGAVVSTAEEMGKYMIGHLNGGGKNGSILKKETLALMVKQHAAFAPKLPGTALGFYDKIKDNRRAVQHDGGGNGYLTTLCLFPESSIGIYIAVNQGENWVTDEILDEFIDKFFPVAATANSNGNPKPLSDYKARVHNYIGTFRFLEGAVTTFGKCDSIFGGQDVEVSENPDGTLTLNGIGFNAAAFKPINMIEVEPQVFKKLGEDGYVAFKADENGVIRYMADSGTSYHGTYRKLSCYELPVLHNTVFIFTMLTFLFDIFLKIAAFIKRRFKKSESNAKIPVPYIGKLASIISVLNVGFFTTMVMTFTRERLLLGVPLDAKLLFCVPLISAALSIAMLGLLIREYTIRQWKLRARIYYTIITLAAVVYIWWLNFWNLLGFKY